MPRHSAPQPHQLPTRAASTGTMLTDDWADFYDAIPDDLVFECTADTRAGREGVCVFHDRLELDGPTSDHPSVVELEKITGWAIIPGDDGTAEVAVRAGRERRARIAAGFAGALTVALTEVLPEKQLAHLSD